MILQSVFFVGLKVVNARRKRLDHAPHVVRLLADHFAGGDRAGKLKRDFEFRHVDNGFLALSLALELFRVAGDGEFHLTVDQRHDSRRSAAHRNRFDLIVRDTDSLQRQTQRKVRGRPGICTAAVLPFKSSGDLIVGLPTM